MSANSGQATVLVHPILEHQKFLDEGRFMLLKARKGEKPFFYPRIAEPGTGDRDLEWVEASGRGAVYSYTVVPGKESDPGYNVVIVDLEEGPRILSRVLEIEPEKVYIGMAVKARIDREEGKGVLYFEPAQGEVPA